MITFFSGSGSPVYVVQSTQNLSLDDQAKLRWLFGNTANINDQLTGAYKGPRKEMVTPWSTNAVEITQNMGISGIDRIEQLEPIASEETIDPMLEMVYDHLDQSIFEIDLEPQAILFIEDIAAYNQQEGLALSAEEIEYLEQVSQKLGRKLTDSEVFGFSQVNSEHCRHKIFNGTFVIDGTEQPKSLFQWIKENIQGVIPTNW